MAGVAAADPRKQYFDTDGNPLAGGFVHVYLAGTTARSNTWQDRAQTTLNTNPIVLDAAGSCLIVLDSLLTYKLVVTNSAGVTQSHLGGDNIVGAAGVQYLTDAITAIEAQETTSVAAVAAAQTTATDAVDALVTQAEGILADTEAARDVAFTNANVYADDTAGLAATASGSQYTIIVGDEAIRKLDTAGVASEVARFPTSTAMRLTALTAGMKKYRSLIPLDCLNDSAYANAERYTLAVRVQDSDLIYKSLGVKHEMPGNNFDSHRVRVYEPVASLDNKWVTVGYIARDAGETFHTNALVARTADDKASSTGAANHTPSAANRRTIQLDATHRLYYAQVQLGTSLDGKYLFMDETTLTNPTDYIAAPFIFVTDSQPTLSELDIFPGERGQFAQDYADATTTDPLLDEIGATLVSDHSTTLANGATTATVTDAEITNVLPSGSVIELPYSATAAARGDFILPSVASLQNKFVHCSVFAYSADGNFTGFSVAPNLRNDSTNVAFTALDDTVRITHISASLRRYDFIGEFRDVWSSYGAMARGARTAASGTTNSIYLFGFMAAVKDEPFVSQYMQPIAWTSQNQPMVGRQFQAQAPVAAALAITAALPITYFAETNDSDPEMAGQLRRLVKEIKKHANWSDVVIIPTTGDLSREDASMLTLGGWTADPLTITGDPTLMQDGLDFGFANTGRYGQLDLPDITSATELTVFQFLKPAYGAGDAGGSTHTRWSFGAAGGNRRVLVRATGAGSGAAVTAYAGAVSARQAGIHKDQYAFAPDDAFMETVHFGSGGLRIFKDGVKIATNLGDAATGDWSPLSIGYTDSNTFWLGVQGGSDATTMYRGRIGFTVVIRNTVLSDAAIIAIQAAVRAAVEVPSPVWKIAPGIEDATGGFAPNTDAFYVIGGDADSSGGGAQNRVYEIPVETGAVETLAATLATPRYKMGRVWLPDLECFELYGGRNSSLGAAYSIIERFFPATGLLQIQAETIPAASAEMAVGYSPSRDAVYGFGGFTGNDSDILRTAIWKRDIATGTVSTIAAVLPTARASMAVIVVPGGGSGGHDAIYLFGGFRNTADFTPRDTDEVLMFDCGDESITTTALTLPYIRDSSYGEWSPTQQKGFIMGSYDSAGGGVVAPQTGYHDDILEFDPFAGGGPTLTTLAATIPRAGDDFATGYDASRDVIWAGPLLPPELPTDNYVRQQKWFAKFDCDARTMELMPFN